jgi:hypothetical protein
MVKKKSIFRPKSEKFYEFFSNLAIGPIYGFYLGEKKKLKISHACVLLRSKDLKFFTYTVDEHRIDKSAQECERRQDGGGEHVQVPQVPYSHPLPAASPQRRYSCIRTAMFLWKFLKTIMSKNTIDIFAPLFHILCKKGGVGWVIIFFVSEAMFISKLF